MGHSEYSHHWFKSETKWYIFPTLGLQYVTVVSQNKAYNKPDTNNIDTIVATVLFSMSVIIVDKLSARVER